MDQIPTNPKPPPPARPAGNQFTLRGMFLLTTVLCIILAVLGLSIRTALHWLGLGLIPAICLIVIACLELAYRLNPPPPQYIVYRSPFAPRGASPFAQTGKLYDHGAEHKPES